MHNIWILCIATVISLSQPLFADGQGTSLKKANGRVYAPSVEMIGPNGEKVLLVGMSHVGFKTYYQRVNAAIKEFAQEDQGTRTVILREFFTATSAVYDNTEGTVSQELVDQLPETDFETEAFRARTEDEVKPWLEAFGMQKTQPMLDVDGQTMRPAYYVERNRASCAEAARFGAACQWIEFAVPDSSNIENAEGDLRIDQWPAGMQFLASTLFRGEKWKLRANNPVRRAAVDAAFRLVTDFRNTQLMSIVKTRLASGDKRLVLPWGAVHVQGLHKLLIEAGFRTAAVRDIMVMDTDDFGKWPDLDESYDNYMYKLSDHYRFQDEATDQHLAGL